MAVTDETVRKRKRMVMLIPGLVAYVVYRLIKQVDPLSNPIVLLWVSGLIASLTAVVAFRVGRQVNFEQVWHEDGIRRLAWISGWIGFVYGSQLSLMVLALLKIFVGYDFLQHPDGPAMMAIIIACTSVARDAFEIGHVRWLEKNGHAVMTFPDGRAIRTLLIHRPGVFLRWFFGATAVGMFVSAVLLGSVKSGPQQIAQASLVAVIGGTAALCAFLEGGRRKGSFWERWCAIGWKQKFQFWWWPGLAFAATYYLALVGIMMFFFRLQEISPLNQVTITGIVVGMMVVYGFYLGQRRADEDLIKQAISPSLLRCPFVMGILSKGANGQAGRAESSAELRLKESGHGT